MTKGKINLVKLDLMGYTPATQVFIVQNAGGAGSVATFHFLNNLRRHFDNTSDGHALRADRIPAFVAYCNRHGFEVAR